MANFDAGQMAVMVKENFEPTFYQTFERNSFFMRFLENMGRKTKYVEKDITWKAYIAGNPAAGSYSEDGSLGINRTDTGPRYTTARLHWRLNRVPIIVSGLAQAFSDSPSAIIDALANSTQDALAELQKNMNRQMLADGLGNLNGVEPSLNAFGADITGVQAMWDDGGDVPIYAGIDRSVNTWWRSFVLRNSAGTDRPITEELMFQILNELEGVREAMIDTVTCSLGVHTQFGLLLANDRRYNFGGNDLPSYVAGFDTLKFKDKLVVGVPLYQRGRMDFWGKENLSFKVLLDFKIEPRDAGDQDAVKMFAKTYAQMCFKNPFHSGSIRNLAE